MVYIKNGGLESIMSIFYIWCKPSTAIINKKVQKLKYRFLHYCLYREMKKLIKCIVLRN